MILIFFQAFLLLDNRDHELTQIKDGALISKHKPKSTKRTQNRAFKEYMKMYYNKPREKVTCFFLILNDIKTKEQLISDINNTLIIVPFTFGIQCNDYLLICYLFLYLA